MSKKSTGRPSAGQKRSKTTKISKPKNKTTNSRSTKSKPVADASIKSSPASNFDNSIDKPALIRGNSTSLEVPINPASPETRSKSVNSDLLRRISILVICSSLVFGIGVQVGKGSNGALVDNAIDTVLETGAQELDRELLERAAISGVLKATG
ncbi:MAG: hypothetical protein RJA01_430, partial [Actinomycetota bacterium]